MKNKTKAFTLSEILIVLTVIGTISAILIPAIHDRVSGKAMLTQRKAIVTILTEAFSRMNNINGIGKESKENASLTFISDSLQKSLKIRTACDSNSLKNCNLPSNFYPNETTKNKIALPSNMGNFFSLGSGIDSKVAGFVTVTGVSVALYYNPDCSKKPKFWDEDTELPVENKVCVNMIYDVNGDKAPNRMGLDMGYATVLYSDTPEVASPEISASSNSSGSPEDLCRNIEKSHQPNIEELASMFVNKSIIGLSDETGTLLSNSTVNKTAQLQLNFSQGIISLSEKPSSGTTRCIKDANRTY